MLPQKLPKLTKPGETLTNEDWRYYFECREKYDKYLTNEQTTELIEKINALDVLNPADQIELEKLGSQIPVPPYLALAIKKVQGLKMLCERNLFEAKKAYPEDF